MAPDDPPDEVFGFAADPAPAARPAPLQAPPAADDIDPGDDPPPRPRVDILDRPLPEPTAPPWQLPAGILAGGLLLCLADIAVVAAQKGAGAGLTLAALAVAGLAVQVLVTSGLLAAVGQFFGIDYGPAGEAVLKLAAVDAVVTGLAGGGGLLAAGGAGWAVPCALLLAAGAGFGLFQALFRLATAEVVVTLLGLLLVGFALNGLIAGALLGGR